jgi:hypothetical protein
MLTLRAVSDRRRRRQGGQEILEFGLIAIMFVPLLLGALITGMGLIRSLQANQMCRDLADIYIHGGDFSTYSYQQIAQQLANGLNLQIGSSFSGSNAANTSNSGAGLVTVTQIMYVGDTSGSNCQGVLPASCTNANSFVFTQRIQFGNGTLNSQAPSSLGDPTTTVITSSGAIVNPVTDAGAKLPSSAQSTMDALWQTTNNGQTPLTDGEVAYVVEVYFQPPGISLGPLSVGGVYARYFF